MTAGFTEELRAFVVFLSSVWGILGSISVFFPLSNLFFDLVPLGPPADQPWLGLKIIDPGLVVAIATVSCIFMVFSTFGRRERLRRQPRDRIQATARTSFGAGLTALLVFLAFFYVVPAAIDQGALIEPTDPVLLVYDSILLLLYTAFFVLLTRAFLLLGLTEYLTIE